MTNVLTECKSCRGRGTVQCARCHGTGQVSSRSVYSGSGIYPGPLGNVDCSVCNGRGELQCLACGGKAAYTTEAADEKDAPGATGADRSHKLGRAEREGTTARLVLAIHHLLDAANVHFDNKAAEIRFIEFLTGRNKDDIAKKLTEILERGNPADKRNKKVKPRSPKARKEDLRFIRPLFKDLRLTTIVNSIDDEIKSIDEDIFSSAEHP